MTHVTAMQFEIRYRPPAVPRVQSIQYIAFKKNQFAAKWGVLREEWCIIPWDVAHLKGIEKCFS